MGITGTQIQDLCVLGKCSTTEPHHKKKMTIIGTIPFHFWKSKKVYSHSEVWRLGFTVHASVSALRKLLQENNGSGWVWATYGLYQAKQWSSQLLFSLSLHWVSGYISIKNQSRMKSREAASQAQLGLHTAQFPGTIFFSGPAQSVPSLLSLGLTQAGRTHGLRCVQQLSPLLPSPLCEVMPKPA